MNNVPGYEQSLEKVNTVKQLELDLDHLAGIFLAIFTVTVCAVVANYLRQWLKYSDPKKNATAATICRIVSILLYIVSWVLLIVAAVLLVHLVISVNEPDSNKATTDLVWEASDKDDINRTALLHLQTQPNMKCCGVTVPNELWNKNRTLSPKAHWRQKYCISDKLPACDQQFHTPKWLPYGTLFMLISCFGFVLAPLRLFRNRWNKIGEKKKSPEVPVTYNDAETGTGRPSAVIPASAPDGHPSVTAADEDVANSNRVAAGSLNNCNDPISDVVDDVTEESTQMLKC